MNGVEVCYELSKCVLFAIKVVSCFQYFRNLCNSKLSWKYVMCGLWIVGFWNNFFFGSRGFSANYIEKKKENQLKIYEIYHNFHTYIRCGGNGDQSIPSTSKNHGLIVITFCVRNFIRSAQLRCQNMKNASLYLIIQSEMLRCTREIENVIVYAKKEKERVKLKQIKTRKMKKTKTKTKTKRFATQTAFARTFQQRIKHILMKTSVWYLISLRSPVVSIHT